MSVQIFLILIFLSTLLMTIMMSTNSLAETYRYYKNICKHIFMVRSSVYPFCPSNLTTDSNSNSIRTAKKAAAIVEQIKEAPLFSFPFSFLPSHLWSYKAKNLRTYNELQKCMFILCNVSVVFSNFFLQNARISNTKTEIMNKEIIKKVKRKLHKMGKKD